MNDETDIRARQSGVQELVDQLRRQGVDAGREQADEVLSRARREADDLVNNARREAARLLNEAKQQAESERQAAIAAVAMAARDTVLRLKEELTSQFADRLRRLVSAELRQGTTLRDMLLQAAAAAPTTLREQAALVTVTAPDPDAASSLLQQVTRAPLPEQWQVQVTTDDTPAIRIRFCDRHVELDLSEQSLARLMQRFLLPRFKSALDGIVE